MKASRFLMLLVAGALFFASCNNEDDNDPKSSDFKVTTSQASGVDEESATLGGSYVKDYAKYVTEAGFYYKKAGESSDTKAVAANKDTPFSAKVEELEANTDYSFKAYVKTSLHGEILGSEVTFKTEANHVESSATATTDDATEVTEDSAVLNGSFTLIGEAQFEEAGFYYKAPGANDFTKVVDANASASNKTLSVKVEGLNDNTQYTFYAFVKITGKDAFAGSQKTFRTLEDTTPVGDFTFCFPALAGATISVNTIENPDTWADITLNGEGVGTLAAKTGKTLKDMKINGGTVLENYLGVKDDVSVTLNIDAAGIVTANTDNDGNILVGTRAELLLLAGDLAGKYVQTNDIDFMSVAWTPVGDSNNVFTGTYDGSGYGLHNLLIDINVNRVGFIGNLGGTLKNVHITSGSVKGGQYVAALAGTCSNNAKIDNCVNEAAVTSGSSGYAGGICGGFGAVTGVEISNCVNKGSITGPKYVGGILGAIGSNSALLVVSSCINSGSVKSTAADAGATDNSDNNIAGGVAGYLRGATGTKMVACYNTGSVTTTYENDNLTLVVKYVGGVVGRLGSTASMSACYNTVELAAYGDGGTYFCDALVGNGSTVTTSFYVAGSTKVGAASKFAADSWPASEDANWGVGNDPENGKYWKDLGTPGTTNYPKLWFEQ